jgi:hypothetical protein
VSRQKLERIAAAVPGLGADSSVIDVGTGAGVLIQHLQVRPRKCGTRMLCSSRVDATLAADAPSNWLACTCAP